MRVKEGWGKQELSQSESCLVYVYEFLCAPVCGLAQGCVDALQSGSIVPIVEKVRGLIKNVWSPDISHRPTAASRGGQHSESSPMIGDWRHASSHVHECGVKPVFFKWWIFSSEAVKTVL